MSSNRFSFSDLEIAPGVMVLEGYAVIIPGSDWVVDELFVGTSDTHLHLVDDPRLFALISEALERDRSDDIAGEFGSNLNSGLGLTYRQVA